MKAAALPSAAACYILYRYCELETFEIFKNLFVVGVNFDDFIVILASGGLVVGDFVIVYNPYDSLLYITGTIDYKINCGVTDFFIVPSSIKIVSQLIQ